MRLRWDSFFLPIDIQLLQPHFLKILSSIELLSLFDKNELGMIASFCFWFLYSIPLICVSVPPLIPHNFDYYSYITNFEIGQTNYIYSFTKSINYLIPLPFHIINAGIILSVTVKNLVGILIQIVLNLHINLGRIHIFPMKNPPLRGHSMSYISVQ